MEFSALIWGNMVFKHGKMSSMKLMESTKHFILVECISYISLIIKQIKMQEAALMILKLYIIIRKLIEARSQSYRKT